MCKVGFIGMGHMSYALARAIKKNESSIIASNRSQEKLLKACKELNIEHSDNISTAQTTKYIFLGVKPQVYQTVIDEIKDTLNNRKDDYIIVTMAAGITIGSIKKMLSNNTKVIRIMPNLPIELDEGMILVSYDDLINEEERREFEALFENSGTLLNIEENKIDVGSAISGCGPAFIYTLIDAMVDGGVSLGLSANEARIMAGQMLVGAGKTTLNSSKGLSVLKNEVCSPNGTTIAGVKKLEECGFRNAIIKAIEAVDKRSKELNKN